MSSSRLFLGGVALQQSPASASPADAHLGIPCQLQASFLQRTGSNVAVLNGFSAQVNLSSSLPVSATSTTCMVNPNMLTNGTAGLTVSTLARGLVPPLQTYEFYLRLRWIPRVLAILLLLLMRFF